MLFIEVFHGDAVFDFFPLIQIQQIDESSPLRGAALQRDVVNLLPVDLPEICEEQQPGVRAGDKQMLHRVFFGVLPAGDALAAAVLSLVRGQRCPLDVTVLRKRDDHRLFGNQIVFVDVGQFFVADFRAAFVAVLGLQSNHVLPHDDQDVRLIGQQTQILGDVVEQFLILALQFLPLQIRERSQLHRDDRFRLVGRERVVRPRAMFIQEIFKAAFAESLRDKF